MRAWLLLLSLLAPATGEQPTGPGAQLLELGPEGYNALRTMQMGNHKKALQQFEVLLEKYPDNRRLHMSIGQVKLSMNDCEGGAEWILRHRTRPTFKLKMAGQLAACSARHGDYANAVYWQEEAALLDPENPNVWSLLGMYRYRQGDYWGVEAALDEAAALDPNDMRLHLAFASIALTEGDHERIDELIARVAEADKGLVNAYVLEARLELDLGNPVLAEQVATKAVKRDIDGTSALVLKAEALRRLGDLEDAAGLLQRREAWYLERPVMWPVHIRVLADQRDFEAADDVLARALDANPHEPELLASGWYLARARGDAEGMAVWADRYEVVAVNPYRTLESLVPLTESPR